MGKTTAVLALSQRADPSPDRSDMLPDGEVEPLHAGCLDLPATGRQDLLDRLQRAEHDPGLYADQTASAHGLEHLRIEELRQRHPPRLGVWSFVLAAWRL